MLHYGHLHSVAWDFNQHAFTSIPFQIFPGLNDEIGTISLESVSQPNYFLRQYENAVYLEHKDKARNKNMFPDDVTFYIREEVSLVHVPVHCTHET